MNKQNQEYAVAEAELDKPVTNRGFLAGCALIAEAIASPTTSNEDNSDRLIEVMQKAIGLFVIDKRCFDDDADK